MLESFLASITSPKLATITFEFVWDDYLDNNISSVADLEAWEDIDETLCTLVDRLPNRGGSDQLSVVLSVRTKEGATLGSAGMGAFLEKFREKCKVTMTPFQGFLQPVCPHSTPPPRDACDLTGWLS